MAVEYRLGDEACCGNNVVIMSSWTSSAAHRHTLSRPHFTLYHVC